MSNPFEILKIDPSATTEEIVRQAGRLRQRASDEATVAVIRQAVQALTGKPEDRCLQELLAHPAPCYSWSALESFVAAFRRPPRPDVATPTATCPPLDLVELAALLRPLLDAELSPPPLPFESIGEPDSPAEMARQTVEAAWQMLPFAEMAPG